MPVFDLVQVPEPPAVIVPLVAKAQVTAFALLVGVKVTTQPAARFVAVAVAVTAAVVAVKATVAPLGVGKVA